MMLTYSINGMKKRYPEGEAPEGAVLLSKKAEPAKVEAKEEPKAEPKKKAIKKPANKARKAGANK